MPKSSKDLVTVIQCHPPALEAYSGHYAVFESYRSDNPDWLHQMEQTSLDESFFKDMGIALMSGNNYFDIYLGPLFENLPKQYWQHKAGQVIEEIMEFRANSNYEDLGAVIIYLLHPESKGITNFIQGIKNLWEEENHHTSIIIVSPE